MSRYLIGSSYFDGGKNGALFRREFAFLWDECVRKTSPSKVVIISEAGSERPCRLPNCDIVDLTGNLGHCEALIEGEKPYEFAGWSASMVALAMVAYVDEADFLYLEEDCLAFGDWVAQTYHDLGSGDIVFGGKMKSAPWMPAAQSLFLVRHSAIPKFVRTYLSLGGDNNRNTLGEHKFVEIARQWGDKAKRLSFGVDRERPIPWDDPVFYFQQSNREEIDEAKRRGLISCNT